MSTGEGHDSEQSYRRLTAPPPAGKWRGGDDLPPEEEDDRRALVDSDDRPFSRVAVPPPRVASPHRSSSPSSSPFSHRASSPPPQRASSPPPHRTSSPPPHRAAVQSPTQQPFAQQHTLAQQQALAKQQHRAAQQQTLVHPPQPRAHQAQPHVGAHDVDARDAPTPLPTPPHHPSVSERLHGGVSATISGQRKITMLIVAQMALVCVVMGVTYGASHAHRDAFNWKGAQIATAVITGWFWVFLLISARAPCFSWIILFLWSVVMGLALGFAGVSTQSFVPLFFVIVQAISATVLCVVSCCSDFTFYYRMGGVVQLFIIGTAWITWWLTHFDGGRATVTYSMCLCGLSILFSLWTLWIVRGTNGFPSNTETRRRALLNLYTLNLVSLLCGAAHGRDDDAETMTAREQVAARWVLVGDDEDTTAHARWDKFTGSSVPHHVNPAVESTYAPPLPSLPPLQDDV